MRFVVDNSVVMRWLFRDGSPEAVGYADRIIDLLAVSDNQALVPCVWALEVGNVIARAEAAGLLPEARSAEFLGILNEMSIEMDSHSSARALSDTLQLARRYKLSTYDASYLELALREGLPLATNDADLEKRGQTPIYGPRGKAAQTTGCAGGLSEIVVCPRFLI